MQAHTPSIFALSAQKAVSELCRDLTKRIQRKVTAEYGATDCEQFHDVALCVADGGLPYPLATIISGPGTPDGCVVLGSTGAPVVEGVRLAKAVQTARFEAVRNFRAMVRA